MLVTVSGGYGGAGGGAGLNKRKGMRPGEMGREDDYGMGSGRFGGPLDREMQFFEKVSTCHTFSAGL